MEPLQEGLRWGPSRACRGRGRRNSTAARGNSTGKCPTQRGSRLGRRGEEDRSLELRLPAKVAELEGAWQTNVRAVCLYSKSREKLQDIWVLLFRLGGFL